MTTHYHYHSPVPPPGSPTTYVLRMKNQDWSGWIILENSSTRGYVEFLDVTLFSDGMVRLDNRVFRLRSAINYHSPKLSVIRGSASRNLVVQVDGESYVFDYSAAGHWYRWTPIVANEGDPVNMDELPRMPWWFEFAGPIFWCVAGAVFLAFWLWSQSRG